MKYLILSVLFIFLAHLNIESQPKLSTEEWIEDVNFLQEKVNFDYQQLFHKVSAKDWNEAANSLKGKIPDLEEHEILVGIGELIAKFGYGHTAMWLTRSKFEDEFGFHKMPYNLYWFSDGVFIQGVHKNYKEALGAKIVKVGNSTVEEALKKIYPVVSAENEQFFKAHGIHYLAIGEVLHAKGIVDDRSRVELTLEKNGKQFKVEFKPVEEDEVHAQYGFIQHKGDWMDARDQSETPLWLRNLERIYEYEYLEEAKTLYVRQSQIQNDEEEDIPTFYSRVFQFIEENDVEKLVLDVRLNGGGNNYNNKPVILGLIKSEKINQLGKLFVITGRRTFSACQNLVNEIENYTNALFVGEPTGENVNFFGDVRAEILPNSQLSIRLSHMWWQDKDPRDMRPWTPPDVAVELSSSDYFNNVDPVLETILTQDNFEKVKEPMDHLRELFEAGKTQELQETAFRYINDPKFKYYDFEGRINEAGYNLLSVDQFQQAIAVLGFNTQLFPDSPNVWDSLAEAYWRAGEIETAKQLYNKVISMDPEGDTGKNARKMLKRMESKH